MIFVNVESFEFPLLAGSKPLEIFTAALLVLAELFLCDDVLQLPDCLLQLAELPITLRNLHCRSRGLAVIALLRSRKILLVRRLLIGLIEQTDDVVRLAYARFMKAAHQGVPVAALPNSQGIAFSNLMQAASQVSPPSAPASAAGPLAPLVSGGANRPAPTRTSARPEAAAGLDGWLVDRLFGR